MKIKHYLLLTGITFFTILSSAYGTQLIEKDSLKTPNLTWIKIKERIYFGGDVGASFGSLTFVEISPLIGYKISERFSMGIGSIYQYYRYNYKTTSGASLIISSSMYGGKVFAREFINDRLYLYSEADILNLEGYNSNTDETKRVNVPLFLVGGGYLVPIGESASFGLNILIDLIDDPYSPFSNPIIRGGFVFGL